MEFRPRVSGTMTVVVRRPAAEFENVTVTHNNSPKQFCTPIVHKDPSSPPRSAQTAHDSNEITSINCNLVSGACKKNGLFEL